MKKKKCHQRIAHFHLASDFTFVTTAAMRRPNRLSPCKLEAFFHSGRNVFIDQNWTGFTGHLRLRSSTTRTLFRIYSRKYEILNAPRFFSSVFVMTHPLGSKKKPQCCRCSASFKSPISLCVVCQHVSRKTMFNPSPRPANIK